ncbi:MAG: TIR domain-containing protein, partial [Sphaerospermopsis kisseleviana]
IGKINWVYFREGIDDFEQSFAGLLELLARHQEYVHKHTLFLAKALEWEREKQQSNYLLVGDERIDAEKWLKIRFKEEQPPCEPTDLHCSFICQSIKNANNLMTHVFLSYPEAERELMDKIAIALMRDSFTVWINKTDIQTGTDLQAATNRGIEEADNIVLLISPDSLASAECQQQLTYALSLNKRIIPILIKPLDQNQIPQALRNIQFIDFTDQTAENKESINADKLINILHQDEGYYHQYKLVLTKALKWERQKRNPSILVRNNDLRNAEAWLKVAKQHQQQSSLPIQEQFIAESLKQPPNAALDVFVSYSNADADFARKLNETLQIQNKTTWFDQESIISGSDFSEELYKGIEFSNNFLFIISPNSISSPYCATEVEYATKLNKRIVTILYHPVEVNQLHPILAKVQWIDFSKPGGDFLTKFGELTRTLDADPDYVKSHTRLLLKAKEWEQQKRDDSFLLRGKDLSASVEWLQESENKQPTPTSLQLEYLAASRALPYRKIKFRSVLFTSLGVTIFIFIARLLGILQPLELAAYDQVGRLRPSEPQDERFLMVDVDPQSIDKMNENPKYQNGRGSIADAALDDALKIISAGQPSMIGLDFIRSFPAESSLGQRLKATNNLISVCKNGYV